VFRSIHGRVRVIGSIEFEMMAQWDQGMWYAWKNEKRYGGSQQNNQSGVKPIRSFPIFVNDDFEKFVGSLTRTLDLLLGLGGVPLPNKLLGTLLHSLRNLPPEFIFLPRPVQNIYNFSLEANFEFHVRLPKPLELVLTKPATALHQSKLSTIQSLKKPFAHVMSAPFVYSQFADSETGSGVIFRSPRHFPGLRVKNAPAPRQLDRALDRNGACAEPVA
jgi:hypothetical protein